MKKRVSYIFLAVSSVLCLYALLLCIFVLQLSSNEKAFSFFDEQGIPEANRAQKSLHNLRTWMGDVISPVEMTRWIYTQMQTRLALENLYRQEYRTWKEKLHLSGEKLSSFVEGEGFLDLKPSYVREKMVSVSDRYKILKSSSPTLLELKELALRIESDIEFLSKYVPIAYEYQKLQSLDSLLNKIGLMQFYYDTRPGYQKEKKELKEKASDFSKKITLFIPQIRDHSGGGKEMEKVISDTETSLSPLFELYTKLSHEETKKRNVLVTKELEKMKKFGITPPKAPYPKVYKQILVSISAQTLYAFENGELILSTPITSGRNDYETIQGEFRIYNKQRGRYLESPFTKDPNNEMYYKLWVDYWMAFSWGYGIHDACNSKNCWRKEFGGKGFVWSGSHGCVNTPYENVRFLYEWAPVGTPVVVR